MHYREWCDYWEALNEPEVKDRPVPEHSGEGAIYSPEYLARKEGNANGVRPNEWKRII